MKQDPRLDRIEKEMGPGRITLPGFLGQDSRKLIDILQEDDAAVKRAGFSHHVIADTMRVFAEAGEKGLGEYLSVPPHFLVRTESVRGKLPCPFGHPGLYHKTSVTVRNERTGEEIRYSDLQIHLIGEHGFYQGKGSPYRLEPRDLARVLEILEIEKT